MIKAVQVSGPGDVRDIERFHVDFHLLDARARARRRRRSCAAAPGRRFDWELLAAAALARSR